MALTDAELAAFRTTVLEAKRPLIFYDDDADGLCSYLLCFRARGDGTGIRVHNSAMLTAEYLRKVEETLPDLIVVLDKPYIEQSFIDAVSVPIVWLDHHDVQQPQGSHITYYNPRKENTADNRCTTYWVWRALGRPEDLWLATVGTISDWQVTEVAAQFHELYPHLLGAVQTAPEALYNEPFGELCQLVQFNLKGEASDVRTSIKILSRIETPEELLEHNSPRSKLIYKRYQLIQKEYKKLLEHARTAATDSPLLYVLFPHVEISLLSEVSNQLIHEFPDKIIFIGREHNGDNKFSIRSVHAPVAPAVKAAMATGIRGNAGGHLHACGGNVKAEDFPKFLEAFKAALKL
jgi:single-stranded DNA-specific DHH superfamily exonuclease